MKTNIKNLYESPLFFEIGFQNDEAILAGSYFTGGGGQYGEDDIIDNGEY